MFEGITRDVPVTMTDRTQCQNSTMDKLDEIRARCEAATPGPWEAKTNRHPQCNGEPWGRIDGANGNITWGGNAGRTNAAFIAHAREDIPRLLAEIERLEETVDYARTIDAENVKMLARAEKAEAELDTYKAELSRMERMISAEREGNKKREHSIGVAVAIYRALELLAKEGE